MPRWTCPRCDRQFGRPRQCHVCAPGLSVAAALAPHPSWVRESYDAVLDALHPCGPVHEDGVGVGVFLLSDRKLAEFRPKVRSAELWLVLPEAPEDPRIARALGGPAERRFCLVNLHGAADVDEEVRGWLTEAFDFATD